MTKTWMVTGANGNLGRKLVRELISEGEHVCAVVRSERAATTVREFVTEHEGFEIRIVDYTDVAALKSAAQNADYVVHLVGIIKEGGGATYHDAHEASVTALVQALADRPNVHVTYLSIVGSQPEATNPCLASKGLAENILVSSANPVCVLRVPMVLGEDDYVSLGLQQRVLSGKAVGFRMTSIEQPIYSGDVTLAIRNAAERCVDLGLDLGGPEALTRAELSIRAGRIFDKDVQVRSLPIGLGKMLAKLLELLQSNPAITPAMLEILDHDDEIDNNQALDALGIDKLTSVDEMLKLTIEIEG